MTNDTKVFRAVMIANGNNDPGDGAKGMLENCAPDEQKYIRALAEALVVVGMVEGEEK